ncbi:MAG: dynamin family protein [Proteobacteria bacterium]|nr:dynamin family protein [Pseudomonadota bacterium]
MSIIQFQEKLHGYGQWREELIRATDCYSRWLEALDSASETEAAQETIRNLRDVLVNERLVVAFVAEFSRGKTELINALFFSDTGLRLLPSLPGRTTMCPTEIFHDPSQESYIRLLPIETRLSDMTLNEHKQHAFMWLQIDLDHTSPLQMQEAFQELAAVKKVTCAEAVKLGLFNREMDGDASAGTQESVEIPCWRHALISFPHTLLKEGLSILDTPGLNALGTEPELTLRMLPSAQAIIFVLAADTGVTNSDLDMWNNHVRGSRNAGKNGLAVAMNKIDSLWGDELQGEDVLETSLCSQVREASNILGVAENLIFPVSAKKALLAKVRRDDVLLEKSRLKGIEDYLTNTVIHDRQRLLRETVVATMGQLVNESVVHIEIEIVDAERQLHGMRQIDTNNQDMTRRLMEETHKYQKSYLSGVDIFQSSHGAFVHKLAKLGEAVSATTIDPLVRSARREMLSSLTTFGMKMAMKKVLEDLRLAMEKAIVRADEAGKLIKAIYGRFEVEYGCTDITPSPISLMDYQLELERIFQEGEEFRQSTSSTLMEQTSVVHKLYSTIIAEARDLFARTHQEINAWGANALSPLARRIKDRRRMIESRLGVLRKVTESSETLDGEIAELEKRLVLLNQQYGEIKEIRRAVSPEIA